MSDKMRKLSEILCSESSFPLYNRTSNEWYLSDCFQYIFIIIPIYTLLAFISSIFIAILTKDSTSQSLNSRNVWFKRLFIIRIIISLIVLITIMSESIVISLNSNPMIAFYISTSIKTIAIFVHLIYIIKHLNNISNSSQRFISMNIIIILILISSVNEFYTIIAKQNYFSHQSISALIVMILWLIYSLTLLPFIKFEIIEDERGLVNEENSNLSIDSDINPNELMNEEKANLISKLFLYWVGPLMTKGVKKTINSHNDLFKLPLKISSQYVNKKFSTIFDSSAENLENSLEPKRKSLLKSLLKCYGLEILLIGLLKFSADALSFAGPLLLNGLVQYLENGDHTSEEGFYYAIGLFISTLLSAIFISLFNFYINKVTLKIRCSIITSIYSKIFSVRSDVLNSNFSTGEVLNFASTDTDRVVNFCPSLLQFISLPIQLAITLYLLHQQLGLAFVTGVAFALILIPINRWICNKIGALSSKMMEWKDKRIKLMSEILMGIRVIKMHCWEELFEKRINFLREQEVKYLKGRKYLDAFCVYFWATTPVLISSLVFGTFVLMNGKLTAPIVFTSLALLGMLIMPLNAFPWVLNGLMEAWVSLKRLQKFFDLHQLDLNKYYNLEISRSDIKIEVIGASFNLLDSSQTNQEMSCRFTLGPIDFTLTNNLFIGVIGKVGSGKSSLLNALVGEMNRLNGKLGVNKYDLESGIAIVTQEAWIQNTTIMENILFGKPLDSQRYQTILDACALVDDLEIFPEGDLTMVGDRGVTLSGGQKARISLARALYQDLDIYLIDDPFASVDIHVAEHIYSKCILGLLKNKSKIVCTHHPKYLLQADIILNLDSGQITAKGPSNEILKSYALEDFNEVTNSSPDKKVDLSETEDDSKPEYKEEEREEGVVKLDVYITYLKSVGIYLSTFILFSILFMQISRSASDCWLAFWTSSNHLNASYGLNNSTYYLIVFITIAAINSVLTLIRAFIFAYGGVVAALKLHYKLLTKIFRAPVLFFDLTAFGRIINRFSTDIFNLDDALPFTLNIFLSQLYSLLASLIITIYGLPYIALVIIPLSIPYYFIQRYYRWTSRELKRLCAVSLSPIYTQLDETLQGLITIRAFANINRFKNEMYRKLDINNKTQYATAASQQWLNLRLQLLGVVISSSVATLAVGLHYWSNQTIDAGLVGLALVYSLSVTGLLNGAVQSFAQTEMDMVSVERVMQYINNIEPEKSIQNTNEQNMIMWPNNGIITFDSVSMRYRSDMPLALENVSFTVKSGEHIGIVGRTGSGKSSLFQVLFRLVNIEEGNIYIDGIDISTISLTTLRSHIFIIPQDPFLFSGTIRDNLDPRSQHSDNEIWLSLKECHLESLVLSLGGLSANISERGRDLSSGQRQLLCFVRALLSKAKILCLDEATASIDHKTETLIQQTIRNMFRSSTILFVAHKIESVLNCDRIIVMDNAKVSEIGTPDSLMQNCNSMFYKLCNR